MTDYALSFDGRLKGINGRIVTFESLDDARREAVKISAMHDITVGISRIAWDIHYGRKFGIKSATPVGKVAGYAWNPVKGKPKPINPDGSI